MSARNNSGRGWRRHLDLFEQARDEYMRAADILATCVLSHQNGDASPAEAKESLTCERQAWARLKFARQRMRNYARYHVLAVG